MFASPLLLLLASLCAGVALAREPFCAWCEHEDDQQLLFAACWPDLAWQPRCLDAWRQQLATAAIVNVTRRAADRALLVELQHNRWAELRGACGDATTHYTELLAAQLDRALDLRRAPAMQMRAVPLPLLLTLAGGDGDAQAAVRALAAECGDAPLLHVLMVGLPTRDAALGGDWRQLIENGERDDETLRRLLFLFVSGDWYGMLDSVRRRLFEVDGALVWSSARGASWSVDRPADEAHGDASASEGAPRVLPSGADLRLRELDALRGHKKFAKSIGAWALAVFARECRFPQLMLAQLDALHAQQVKVGVHVAHLMRDAAPDTDQDARADAWKDKTHYQHKAIDDRVQELRQVIEQCRRQQPQQIAIAEHDFAAAVSRLIALQKSPQVAHRESFDAALFTREAETRRSAAAALARGGGDCARYTALLRSGAQVAENGKKAVYRLNTTHGMKLVLPHARDEYAKAWKFDRVLAKQTRDLIYERWLLPRMRRVQGVVKLHASFNVQNCAAPHNGSAAPVNVLEFVPRPLTALRDQSAGVGAQQRNCRALRAALDGAQLLLDLERGSEGHSWFVCDFKPDNFGLSADWRLRMFDVDSIRGYAHGTRYMWDKYCDEEDKKMRRQFKSECMQPCGAFRNAMRAGVAPNELFCNTKTRLCDGYDARSNVWGFASSVLPVLFGGEPNSRKLPSDAPSNRQLYKLLIAATADDREQRLTPRQLFDGLHRIYEKTQCDRVFIL